MRAVRDIVVLVPSFLGFDSIGGIRELGDSVATGIRVALEERTKLDASELAIVPCRARTSGSLATRQRELFAELGAIVRHHGRHTPLGELRLHLVGHGVGGLDAELLTYERPLAGGAFREEELALRRALRTVVTIAAPLSGTHLADSALARLVTSGRASAAGDAIGFLSAGSLTEGPRQLARSLLAGGKLVGSDLLHGELVRGALFDAPICARIVRGLLLNRALLSDLRPATMRELLLRVRPDATLTELHRARIVTVARNATLSLASSELFEALYRLTAQNAPASEEESLALAGFERGIRAGTLPVIGAVMPPLPLTRESSDGIVNLALQLSHWDLHPHKGEKPAHVAALVVADHLDALGYFTPESRVHRARAHGVLSSGSAFGEPEFSRLWRAVAGEVALGLAPGAVKRLGASGEARQIVLRKSSEPVRSGAHEG